MIITKYLTNFKKIIKASQNTTFIYKPNSTFQAKIFVKYYPKIKNHEALIQIYYKNKKIKENKIKPEYNLKSSLIEEINSFLQKEKKKYKKEESKIIKNKINLNLDLEELEDLSEEKTKKKKTYSLSYLQHLKYSDGKDLLQKYVKFLKNISKEDRKKLFTNKRYASLIQNIAYHFNKKYDVSKNDIIDIYKYYFNPVLNSKEISLSTKIKFCISFLPLSLNDKNTFFKIFNWLNKNIKKRKFISSYKNINKPKIILNEKEVTKFLISNILNNILEKNKENLRLVSAMFLYHITEKKEIETDIEISSAQFRILDSTVKKIYPSGLSINTFKKNNSDILFKDLKILIKKYEKEKKLNLIKAKIFKNFNFYLEKYNNNLIEKLQKISTRIQKNTEITPERKEALEKYIKGIKKLKHIPWKWESIFKYHSMRNLSNYEYPFEIKVYEALYKHYLLNSEIKKDNLKSKIKKIFFSNLFYKKENEEENLKRIINYIEAEKRTIKYYKKMLIEIDEEIEKTFPEVKEKLLKIGEFLLKENNSNLNLKKIILEYQEKYIIPLIKNNELSYTLLKNKINSQINYTKILEEKIKERLKKLKGK